MPVCEVGVCDGSRLDRGRRDDGAPCACRAIKAKRKQSRRLGTGIPKRFRGVGFDRKPIVDMDPDAHAPDPHVRPQHRARTSTRAAGSGCSATSARARRRWRCSSRRPRSRPAARSRSTRCRACWPTSRRPTRIARSSSYMQLFERLRRRRPAAHRRPRRREAHRVGARAALLDHQRALAGAALDVVTTNLIDVDELRDADRPAHGLAAARDVRA